MFYVKKSQWLNIYDWLHIYTMIVVSNMLKMADKCTVKKYLFNAGA